MKIIDTVPYFTKNYTPSIQFLRNYYNEYSSIFNEYFSYHCKDTEERHSQSICKYPQSMSAIKQVYQNIVPIILEITEEYNKLYRVAFPVDVNLIIGGFGSNAFTSRQIIPNITFSLEKLSPDPIHLRAIVAHEFGHAAHNIISNDARMDWTKIQWTNPLTWLNQEGVAIHFSRRTVPNLKPSIYFSFDDEGDKWLDFCNRNNQEIKKAFANDLFTLTAELFFREWFSINGGNKFGFSRLGYFIGDLFFQNQIEKLGEHEAIIAWQNTDFIDNVKHWFTN